MKTMALIGMLVLIVAQHVSATDVAIVAAATNSNIESTRFTDLRDVLVADGRFGIVDIISTTRFGTGTPSLDQLLQYDSIIHWSNDSNEDSISLGNVFADYVDEGRGLVQAVFANTSTNSDRYLRGRWIEGDYNIIPPMGGFVQGATTGSGATATANMAAPIEPDHPVFDGVGEVRLSTGQFQSGGLFGAWRAATEMLEPNSRKLALFEDGKTAIAASDIYPNRIDLGFHPVSDLVNDGYYDSSSDTGKLIANALLFTASPDNTPELDLNDDGQLDCTDIDVLTEAIVGAIPDLLFDLTGDGIVNIDDRNLWLAEAGPQNGLAGGYLPGDANLDGVVDVGDFNIWNANKFSNQARWCLADFTTDGVVDVSDFAVWNANKFTASNAVAVPEPATIWLLLIGTLVTLARVQKRVGAM
ncbi:MAG: PEP-CTERM sorting domain-containing protein [Planctomycetota bacterium]